MNQMQHDFVAGPVAKDYGKLLGTPFKVFLVNGVSEKPDADTGKLMTEIVDLPGLIASILQARILHPRKLSGADLKFIRSALGMRSAELAEALEVSPEHYSRCEAGVKTLSTSSEKFLRMYVFLNAILKDLDFRKEITKRKRQRREDGNKEEAKKALAVFKKVFLDMKIQNIFQAGDDLEFSFKRKEHKEDHPCEDDGEWLEDNGELLGAA